jgi:hypothetical protein
VLAIALLVMGAAQFALLSTDIGQELTLDQQVSAMEAFGVTVTDEMYTRMEQGMDNARYTGPLATMFSVPLIMLITAGILHVIFGLVGGGNGTYKQVYAISAHTAVITALQLVFTTTVTPTLEDTTFVYKFLSYIDLFYVWSTFITAVGLGVLYKRRTGPIAMVLFSIYFVIAALIALATSGS